MEDTWPPQWYSQRTLYFRIGLWTPRSSDPPNYDTHLAFLYSAIKTGDMEGLSRVLNYPKTHLDMYELMRTQDRAGRSLLHYVALRGDTGILKCLLECVSHEVQFELLMVTCWSAKRAIHYAAEKGHTEMFKYILDMFPWEKQKQLMAQPNGYGLDAATRKRLRLCGSALARVAQGLEEKIPELKSTKDQQITDLRERISQQATEIEDYVEMVAVLTAQSDGEREKIEQLKDVAEKIEDLTAELTGVIQSLHAMGALMEDDQKERNEQMKGLSEKVDTIASRLDKEPGGKKEMKAGQLPEVTTTAVPDIGTIDNLAYPTNTANNTRAHGAERNSLSLTFSLPSILSTDDLANPDIY